MREQLPGEITTTGLVGLSPQDWEFLRLNPYVDHPWGARAYHRTLRWIRESLV